jgi:hypothetical protein
MQLSSRQNRKLQLRGHWPELRNRKVRGLSAGVTVLASRKSLNV